MVCLAPEEIFENMLQLKRFGIYFERILNNKLPLSIFHIEIMVLATCTHANGFEGMLSENKLK